MRCDFHRSDAALTGQGLFTIKGIPESKPLQMIQDVIQTVSESPPPPLAVPGDTPTASLQL